MNSYNTSIFADVLALTEEVNQISSIQEIQQLVLSKLKNFGVEYIFAGIIPLKCISPEQQLTNVMFGNLPDEWATRYFRHNYLEQDPTIHHLRQSDRTLSWNKLRRQSSLVMNEAAEFQLQSGITIPMISLSGVKLGMSFAGTRISQSPECMVFCQFISAIATARAFELMHSDSKKEQQQTKLTTADYNCLRWAAEGKTNWDIGKILSISERTVEKHMRNCFLKTNTLNRAQLVANSLRSGLLT